MADFEIVLRTAAVLILAMLASSMLAARRRDHTPWLGAACCAAVASFVLTSSAGAAGWLGGWLYPLTALCVSKAVLFWLFAKGLFADDFRVRPWQLGLIAVTAAYGVWQQLFFLERIRLGLASVGEKIASGGFELLVLTFVILALVEANRGLIGDLVERRRRLRIVFVVAVSAYLAAAVFVQAYNLVQDAETPPFLATINLTLIAAAGFVAVRNLFEMRAGNWLEPDAGGASANRLLPAEQRVLASLTELFDRHQAWREEGLTISGLAARLGTREQLLRHVINRGLGFRNFNDFLHAYRIREACQRLRQPEDSRLPVLSIALGVGYGSIGPFNRAFKARIGMTPTRFRREAAHAPNRLS